MRCVLTIPAISTFHVRHLSWNHALYAPRFGSLLSETSRWGRERVTGDEAHLQCPTARQLRHLEQYDVELTICSLILFPSSSIVLILLRSQRSLAGLGSNASTHKSMPMVVMNDGVHESSQNLRRRHDLPTPVGERHGQAEVLAASREGPCCAIWRPCYDGRGNGDMRQGMVICT